MPSKAQVFNKAMGYKPYKGGAGPNERQEAALLGALQSALQKLGVSNSIGLLDNAEFGYDVVPNVVSVAGKPPVGYDRWGYVTEGRGDDGELDQADLYAACVYLAGQASVDNWLANLE